MAVLTCGDNTGAFGGSFITINLKNNTGREVIISKAVFGCGPISLTFDNPTFPLVINLSEEQTEYLSCENTAYLAVWDENGRKLTCSGSLTFKTQPRKV